MLYNTKFKLTPVIATQTRNEAENDRNEQRLLELLKNKNIDSATRQNLFEDFFYRIENLKESQKEKPKLIEPPQQVIVKKVVKRATLAKKKKVQNVVPPAQAPPPQKTNAPVNKFKKTFVMPQKKAPPPPSKIPRTIRKPALPPEARGFSPKHTRSARQYGTGTLHINQWK